MKEIYIRNMSPNNSMVNDDGEETSFSNAEISINGADWEQVIIISNEW